MEVGGGVRLAIEETLCDRSCKPISNSSLAADRLSKTPCMAAEANAEPNANLCIGMPMECVSSISILLQGDVRVLGYGRRAAIGELVRKRF